MSDERIQRKLTSWEMLKVTTQDWLTVQRAQVNRTGFAHPDEVAERVLAKIHGFVRVQGDEASIRKINEAFRLIDYSDVIDLGQLAYVSYLKQHPDIKRQHIVESILESLVPQKPS